MKMFIELSVMFTCFILILILILNLIRNYKENKKKMIRVLVLTSSVFFIAYFFGNMDFLICLFIFCTSFLITIACDYVLNKLFTYWEKEKSIKEWGPFAFVSCIVGVLYLFWLIKYSGYETIPLSAGTIVIAAMGGYAGSQFNLT